MKLSLCAIVRDEEASLGRMLDSVRGVVDELCILDTGSRDRTREIATERGARVASFPWCDDFSAARNAAFELASGDWILVLDADEELVSGDARTCIERFAAAGDDRVGACEIHNFEGDRLTSRVNVSRLVPRARGFAFAGRIHEQLQHASGSTSRSPTGLVIVHHGYTRAIVTQRNKVERNLALLEIETRCRPDDPYAWYQLGRTHQVGGDHARALQAFEAALEQLPDDAPYAAHLIESAASALRASGKSAHALAWLRPVAATFEKRADTAFLLGLLALDVGDVELAEAEFSRALALGPATSEHGEASVDAGTVAPAHNLGVLNECLGRPAAARAFYERALAFDSAHAPSRAGLLRLG